jgi:hypothetical protein
VINKELDVMEGLAASKTGEEPTRSISGKWAGNAAAPAT